MKLNIFYIWLIGHCFVFCEMLFMSFDPIFFLDLLYYVFSYILFMGTNLLLLILLSINNHCCKYVHPVCGSPFHSLGVWWVFFCCFVFDKQKFLIQSNTLIFCGLPQGSSKAFGSNQAYGLFLRIKFYWDTDMSILLHVVCDHFPAIWQSRVAAREATGLEKSKIFTVFPSQKKFANFCLPQSHKHLFFFYKSCSLMYFYQTGM